MIELRHRMRAVRGMPGGAAEPPTFLLAMLIGLELTLAVAMVVMRRPGAAAIDWTDPVAVAVAYTEQALESDCQGAASFVLPAGRDFFAAACPYIVRLLAGRSGITHAEVAKGDSTGDTITVQVSVGPGGTNHTFTSDVRMRRCHETWWVDLSPQGCG